MKRTVLYLLCGALALAGCGKLGKDGRVKQDVDWSAWYNDEGDGSKPGVMIMSFNVRLASAADDTGDKNWTNRRTGCYAMVNALRPVLMGTQECQPVQRNDLENNCPGYGVVGKGRDGTNGEQMAIFYLKDSIRMESSTTFWLSDTPDKQSKPSAAEHYRIANCAKVTHIKTGKQFYQIDTHLDLGPVRGYEVGVILKYIRERLDSSLPIVVNADWNEVEDSPIFDELYAEGFLNARWTARTGDSYGTFNGFTDPNKTTKIDHIFYRGFSACAKFVTVRQKWEGYQFISDHYPVYAVLEF